MSGATLHVSRNEIAFLVRWAARGTGMPVGLAEDLAAATRVLALAGLDPLRLVVPALEELAADRQWGSLEVDGSGRLLSRMAAPVAAVEGGAALADLMLQGRPAKTVAMDHPLLAVAIIAGLGAEGWVLSGNGCAIRLGAGRFQELAAASEAALFGSSPVPLSCHGKIENLSPAPYRLDPAALAQRAQSVSQNGVAVDGTLWDRLKALAGRSWVPTSEHSRMAGAGAGLIDTD